MCEFFNCIDWSRCSKASLLKVPCSRYYAMLPKTLLPQLVGLSSQPSLAVAFSCLTQGYLASSGHQASMTEGYSCFTIPTFSPNSRQLCRACPDSELTMASAKASLWLYPSPLSPHAQSCSSYRCGSQSAPQHTLCTDSLSSSMFPRNQTFTSRAWKRWGCLCQWGQVDYGFSLLAFGQVFMARSSHYTPWRGLCSSLSPSSYSFTPLPEVMF